MSNAKEPYIPFVRGPRKRTKFSRKMHFPKNGSATQHKRCLVFLRDNPGWQLVHAVCRGPLRGTRVLAFWCEKSLDGLLVCWNPNNGQQLAAGLHYPIMRVVHCKRYSYTMAKRLHRQKGNVRPWNVYLKKVLKKPR